MTKCRNEECVLYFRNDEPKNYFRNDEPSEIGNLHFGMKTFRNEDFGMKTFRNDTMYHLILYSVKQVTLIITMIITIKVKSLLVSRK